MALVSPGVQVTIVDDSFYVPASAPTVPLFFIATRADKKKLDNVTAAPGSREHSIVRTITSLSSSIDTYGVPYFRRDNSFNELHGDCRNEYGLFALNQYLNVGNVAYVVRANVDLADDPVTTLVPAAPTFVGAGNGTLTTLAVSQTLGQAEVRTVTALTSTTFSVAGFLSGTQPTATVGTPYNNGIVSFTLTAGSTPFTAGDAFTFTINTSTAANPLGANDAAKRVSIVTALKAEINSNIDVRSDYYEYNIILCPGYHETVPEMLNLSTAINEEAFVIADTPFDKSPEDTATWALTAARSRSVNVGYYYPHGIASNLDGRSVYVAASGTALKTFAYTSSVAEVWYPPAGFRRGVVTGVSPMGYLQGTLGGVTKVIETPLSQGQRDVLYEFQKNVNIIPYYPGRGWTVMGQKTSASAASALDRVNVVLMLQKVKRDIRKLSMIYLHELNDRITRDSIRGVIHDYLNDIMVRRGLYDFLVVCDASNNTPTRVDRNELWVNVFLKPTKSVEFIYVPIKVQSTGATLGQ